MIKLEYKFESESELIEHVSSINRAKIMTYKANDWYNSLRSIIKHDTKTALSNDAELNILSVMTDLYEVINNEV
jgi:hypothetical protein